MNQSAVLYGDYGCEINLTVFGNWLMVRRFAGSVAIAVDDVLKEETERLEEREANQKDLPVLLYSSVEVLWSKENEVVNKTDSCMRAMWAYRSSSDGF